MEKNLNTRNLKIDRHPYMLQLDTFRAFAVTAVAIHHFTNNQWGSGANIGLKYFFVLSGYLVTKILLRSRNAIETKSQKKGFVLRQFYSRRCIRIFPIYYLVIVVAFVINLDPVMDILGWLLTFSLNIYMGNQGWYVNHFAHFQALAVEMHFYIFWPIVVLYVPRKWLIPVTLAVVATGPFYRFYEGILTDYTLAAYIFTPACLDTLGMGSLIAMVEDFHHSRKNQGYLIKLTLLTGVTLKIILYFMHNWKLNVILDDLALSLIFFWLISTAGKGFGGMVGGVLEFQPFVYIGKISYGIYVYHPFMPYIWLSIFNKLGFSYPMGSYLGIILSALLTMIVSSISWHLVEMPINGLKRYFTYFPNSIKS